MANRTPLLPLLAVLMLCLIHFCSGCVERERRALLSFKRSLIDPSNRLSSWVGQNCCEWNGVGCNNNTAHVVELNLINPHLGMDDNSLVGREVDPSLMELKHLESLDLSFNNFAGSEIPKFIGNFTKLRHLWLSRAGFGGAVPASLGQLSNLEWLDLRYNNFAGSEIPKFIGNFTKLRYLWLSRAGFGGAVPASLGNLSKLEELDLSENSLSGVVSEIHFERLSRLEQLDLSSNSLVFKISSNWPPPCQPSFINLESCFVGPRFPHWLRNQSRIEYLRLRNASISDSIPEWFPNIASNFNYVDLSDNQIHGLVPDLSRNITNSSYFSLDLSFNKLEGPLPPFPSNIIHIDISNNFISGSLPQNIIDLMPNLISLSLSNNFISGSLPQNISDMMPYLMSLSLSHNFISGSLPQNISDMRPILISLSLSNNFISGSLPQNISDMMPNLRELSLSNNFISGSLPQNISDMMPNLQMLLLSNNSISGRIPTSLCRSSELSVIDLSNNKFLGEIPQNCWSNLKDRMVMDLANNNLTGAVPSSNFSDICELKILRLSSNNLYGEILPALRKCQDLETIDIGKNKFSGNIPSWIGGFSILTFLSLRSNKFEGSIAPELCRAQNIRVLDLAENKFSGTILPCFKNFTGMKLGDKLGGLIPFGYLRELNQEMKGRELLYTSTLAFLVNLDLSSNNLQGSIPKELTFLIKLCGLNLSYNQLTGEIPKEIGNLRLLESLDFSNNLLTGTIPQSISELTSISYLDLSYNNLSGRIPTGNQLQTLEPWIYRGNPSLCGMQIEKLCAEDEPIRRNDTDDQVKDEHFEMVWFYISMIIGFAVGFWGVWGVLLCKKVWRAAYFRFVENVHDMVLVKVGQMCRA